MTKYGSVTLDDIGAEHVRREPSRRGSVVANAAGRRYRYGSSFVDQASGVRFEGHHPFERPDLWQIYREEGEGKYRSRGFEGTMRRQELEDGHGVSLFLLGFSPEGKVVAGVRFHGPLEGSYEAAIIEEMASSPEIDDIAALIDQEVRLGAIEVKGAWSKGAAGHRLVQTLSRSVTHAMNWLGAEFPGAGISDTWLPLGSPPGARPVGTAAVPYPDDRFHTIAVEWRRARSHDLSTPRHQQALRLEAEQLSRGPARESIGSIEEDSTRTRSWKPLVLDVATRSQREMLRALREDNALQIIDRFDEQREQLGQLLPTPSPAMLEDGQRWVYFPWRRAIVRLLAPKSFATLRLDRNRNKMTRAEQARQRTLRIGVVGMSAGHSIAHVLAMEGLAGEIRIADFDTVELSNLNRIPASVLDLGLNKAVVAARRIAEIDPYLKVVMMPEGITPENLGTFLDGLDLVIEECDSLDVKLLVREAARERYIPVMMETSDRGVLDVERFDLEPERPIFHGLLGDIKYSMLEGLTTAEKSPYALRILGASDVSSRAAASMIELGQTITAWPQLASEVTLGAATTAAAVRRLALGEHLPSGRVRFDVEEILNSIGPVPLETEAEIDLALAPPEDPPLESDDPIALMADAARRAPSGGNIQPWRFEANDHEVRFFMLPDRTSMMDVQHRGSHVAVGAALFNARTVAASLHQLGPVQLFPSGPKSHHLATVQLGNERDPEIAPLRAYVHTRSTNRHIGRPAPIDEATLAHLVRGVEREGARLRVMVAREEIDRCAQLLADSDRLRFLLPQVHHEMNSELRWPGRDALEEGLDVRTLEMDPFGYAAMELLGRPDVMTHLADWRGGQALGLRTRAAVSLSSAVVTVTVPRPEPKWYVRGGAALERFWLSAEQYGLAVQPASPVFLYAVDEQDMLKLGGERYLEEMVRLSQRFNELWGLDDGESMIMVLRVHHAPPPSVHSIRLPLSRVLSREQ